MENLSLEQKFIESSGGKLFYYKNKSFADRPTLIFLHGLSSNHTTWLTVAQALENLKLNFLLPDLRGHGHSDKTKKRELYKFSVFTQDLKKIIEAERLDKIILIGYSFGGYIALDYAIKYPEDLVGLILISTNHVNPFVYKRIGFFTWPARGILEGLAALFFWQKRKNYLYFEQGKSRGYWEAVFKGYLTMPVSLTFWMISQTLAIDYSREIGAISCPTLIIKSKNDIFLREREARAMVGKLKKSKILTLDESTHFLASRHQEKIADIMKKFLVDEKLI